VSTLLAESIIHIGRPIMNSDIPNQEKIRLLTDVSSENCKNYFRNVFLIELGEGTSVVEILEIGNLGEKNKFQVDQIRNTSFPIFYPNGGDPTKAQGTYSLPCYLMYDKHIKFMDQPDIFAKKVILPRIESTLGYRDLESEEKENIAKKIAVLLKNKADEIIGSEKQLGILMIFDERLEVYKKLNERIKDDQYLWITESKLSPGENLYLVSNKTLQKIVESKVDEASTLGQEKKGISTFSNQEEENLVSIYNKSWLWLSPTWEMPRSIYWKKNEWTKGIKVDHQSYEAFLYGVQFLKGLQVPISASVLKEMFAPVSSVEAKKHMKPTSFEQIFGIPMVIPILDGDSKQIIGKYKRMLKKQEKMSNSDLHLEILAGMKGSIVPESSDEHRLTIIYYSGDLSRGNMHIRAVIEDVLPSVANKIQIILRSLTTKGLKEIQEIFGLEEQRIYRTENLPSLLANAFGAGYLWNVLQGTLHKKTLRIERLRVAIAKKLNELANKEDYWNMKQELVFYYAFLFFLKRYEENVLEKEKGVSELVEWQEIISKYHQGEIALEDLNSLESLGFITGLLLKQFSNSYYTKTGKDFVKHRVMKFGSKLTPEMIWKNGALRCEELAEQWNLKLGNNFRMTLPHVLLGFLQANQKKLLVVEKENFMTAFWSGYLIYQQTKKNEKEQKEEVIDK